MPNRCGLLLLLPLLTVAKASMPAKSSATNPCGGTWKRWKNSVVPVNACRENPDRSFTAVLSSGCDVCDPNGDLCINFVVETTFTTADRYIYSMERLCYQFIQGNESGYFCSETIRHAYRGIDEHTFSYNHEPCEMLEGNSGIIRALIAMGSTLI